MNYHESPGFPGLTFDAHKMYHRKFSIANILKTSHEIDAALAGVSDQTKPKSRWAAFMQRRGHGAYTEDAVQGMLRYMTVAEYKLAYDPLIAHFRETAKIFRAAATESNARNANDFNTWLDRWTNSIAGKSNDLDRLISDTVGNRKLIASMRWLNNRVKSNAVLGNFRSAIVQFSNITNAASYIKNPADWARGARSLAEMWCGKDKGEMREIYGQSNFMSQRYLDVGSLDESILKKPKQFAVWMLTAGDKSSAQLMWWAAYEQYSRNPGVVSSMSRQYESAVDYADDITRRSVAGRGVGELPLALTSQTVQMIVPFQTEIVNTFNNLREQIGKKNALGLVAFEITTFAFNSVFEALLGDSVLGFDFIRALIDAIQHAGRDDEDKEETTASYAIQRVLGEIASGVPFSAQLAKTFIPDDARREKMFGDADPTRYGTGTLGLSAVSDIVNIVGNLADGEGVDPFDIADAVSNVLLPWGGKQLSRTARGVETVAKGYGSKVDKEGEERIQFAVDKTPKNYVKAGLFGKWTLPEAREYLDNPSLLSAEDSEIYKQAVAAGVDGDHFFDLRRQMREFEPIKDDDGKTVESKNLQRARLLAEDKELTPEQKALLIQPLVDARVAEKAAIAAQGGVTADEFLGFYIANADIMPKVGEDGKQITAARQRAQLILSYGWDDKKTMAILESCGNDAKEAYERAQEAESFGYGVKEALQYYVDGVSETTVGYGQQIYKEAGVPVGDYIGWYKRKGELVEEHKNGTNKYAAKNAFQDELMQSDLTPEQKAVVERTVYGSDYSCDYTTEYTMRISRYNSSSQSATWSEKCDAINKTYGIDMKTLSEAVVAFKSLETQNAANTAAILRALGVPAQYHKTVFKLFDSDWRTLKKWKLGKYSDSTQAADAQIIGALGRGTP